MLSIMTSPVPTERSVLRSRLQHARRLGDMRCDRVHQWRRETVVRLEAELAQSAAYTVLLRRVGAALDDRRDERGEAWRRPARVGRQFGVNEIEAIERMVGVLDPAIHMYPAALAC